MNINENIRNEKKSIEKNNGVYLQKLLISQLPFNTNFKIWYLIKAHIVMFYSIIL